jgi:hypothetical protein
MGPEVAAAASIGSLALDAGGKLVRGQGEAATQEYLAKRDERAAELGRLRAVQTDVALRDELTTTLANIDAIRAAANIDITSPTTFAIKGHETEVSDRQREIKVASINAQADEDEASARYRRRVAEDALFGSYLGAGASLLKGLGSLGKGA